MSSETNETINGSLIKNMDDVFIDDDDDFYSESRVLERQILGYIYFFLELLKLIFCVLAFASDIYLIVIISKYKNLQNRINKFILQYAIFNLLYLVLANILLLIFELSHHYYNFCFVHNVDHLLATLSFYILTFMAVDWYVLNYHLNIYEQYPRLFKYGAYIVSLFAISKWIVTASVCFVDFHDAFFIRFCFEEASLTLCLIIVICITILKHKKVSVEAYKTEYALTISRTVLLLSLPTYIVSLILELMDKGSYKIKSMRIMYMLQTAAELLLLGAPIVVVYLLAKTNKHFKMAHLKCCKKRVRDYNDDNLDVESVNEVEASNVTFDKDTEVINF